jgi:hypothetical protein
MPRFLVADEDTSLWGHIFPDQRERMTRFVFEMETSLLLAVQIETGPVSGWRDATPAELLDVAEDLVTNRPFDDPAAWDLGIADSAPIWAERIVADAKAAYDAISDDAVRAENLVPGSAMEYDEWLRWSGLDDSFVGDLQRGIPGTRDKFEASLRLTEQVSAPTP